MEIPTRLLNKAKLCLSPLTVDDKKISNALEDVYWYILNYCAIKEVPEALYSVWANMAVDALRFQAVEGIGLGPESEAKEGVITSLSEGDTSISYGSISAGTADENILNSHKANLDTVVLNYIAQLNAFKRFRW